MSATVYTLAFRETTQSGKRTVVVLGTVCGTRSAAERLRFDREANGDAFPGEFVVKVTTDTILRSTMHVGGGK